MDTLGARCPVKLLAVALDVPEIFQPKAAFALKSLLYPLGISIEWVTPEVLTGRGGLYYGIAGNFTGVTKPIVALRVAASTLSYFELGLPVSNLNVFKLQHENQELPVLFGRPVHDSDGEQVDVYEADLIASAFFWLSDWENLHRSDMDIHGRALYQGSLQQRLNLAFRCLVDEYRAVLCDWMSSLWWVSTQPVRSEWSSLFTHDVDRIRKRTFGILFREVWMYWIENKQKTTFSLRTRQLVRSILQFWTHDAYKDSLLSFIRMEHLHRIKGTYLFKSILQKHPHDAKDYLGDRFFGQLMTWLRSLDHEPGYHSGYLAGYDADLLRREHLQFVEKTGLHPVLHRSHYLRYDAIVLFTTLVELGYHFDSSIAWADHVGSRTQTCHPHAIFAKHQNATLPLIEIPLMIMDTQMMGYMKLDPEEALHCIEQCVALVKRHHGLMVWNFHHHGFDPIDAPEWDRFIRYAYQVCKASRPFRYSDIDRANILNT